MLRQNATTVSTARSLHSIAKGALESSSWPLSVRSKEVKNLNCGSELHHNSGC